MNPHPQLNMRMILQGPANLESTSRRFFRAVEEKQRHPVSRRHSIEFAACFRRPKAFRSAHDLLQLLQQFNLLIHQQFRITHYVDQQEVCDLEGEIRLSLGRRVLGVHPVAKIAIPLPVIESK